MCGELRLFATPVAEQRERKSSYGGKPPAVQRVREPVPAGGPVRLRALLRPARSGLRKPPRATSASCGARSRAARRTSGATPTSCPSPGTARPVRPALEPRRPPPGCTPLMRADRLAAELGLRELWVKNDAANPTHSFKDRVVSVAVARARELGFDTIACASTGNLANPSRRTPPRWARVLRVHPRRPRGAEDPRDRGLRDEPRRRAGQLRRSQPPVHRTVRRTRLGVREHQHAPVLRRGLQDARLRDRRAARLGRPTGSSRRSRRARCSRRSPRASGVARARADRRRPAAR